MIYININGKWTKIDVNELLQILQPGVFKKTKLDLANESIRENLENAAKKDEIIATTPEQRAIGKTRALFDFAKHYNYGVVVKSDVMKRMMRKYYFYHHVYTLSDLKNVDAIPFNIVIDEGFKDEDIKQIMKIGHRVVTGFIVSDNETIYK